MRLGAGDFALTLALRRALQLRHVDFLGPPERPSCKRRAPVVDHSPSPILGSERLIWPFGICRFGRTKPIFSIPFKELHFRHRCRARASPRNSTSAARSATNSRSRSAACITASSIAPATSLSGGRSSASMRSRSPPSSGTGPGPFVRLRREPPVGLPASAFAPAARRRQGRDGQPTRDEPPQCAEKHGTADDQRQRSLAAKRAPPRIDRRDPRRTARRSRKLPGLRSSNSRRIPAPKSGRKRARASSFFETSANVPFRLTKQVDYFLSLGGLEPGLTLLQGSIATFGTVFDDLRMAAS